MKKVKKIILWVLLAISVFCMIAALSGMALGEDIVTNGNDIILYTAAFTTLFFSISMCFVIALIRCSIPEKGNAKKRNLWWLYVSICLIGLVGYAAIYSGVSDEFKASMAASQTIPQGQETTPVKEQPEETQQPTARPTEPTVKPTEPLQEETTPPTTLPQEKESVFSVLTDDQFCMLTDAVAKSFYSFRLEDSDYQALSAETKVMDCLTQIYQYANKNNFELDPEFKAAFSERYEVVKSISTYTLLQQRFMIEYYHDNSSNVWVYNIDSYTLDPKDVSIYDDVIYLDAEGYLKKGVTLYWEEDGVMEKVAEVVDIAHDVEIDGTIFGYAVNIKFYDDPYSSGWTDGERILTVNKKITGKPIYYVQALDPNRAIAKEAIDYNNSVNWKPLTKYNLKPGIEVYSGITDTKSYTFTVVSFDAVSDIMIVCYPSGSVGVKSYSAMLGLKTLYIK